MKDDFDPLPLRRPLTAWHNADVARRRFHSTVEKAQAGTSVENPAAVPESVAKKSAAERCQWALSQLAEERITLALSHREQELGAALRARLVQLKNQKQAAEQSAARKRMRRLSLVAAVIVVFVAIVAAIWWQRRPPSISKTAVEQSLARELAKRGVSLESISFETGPKHGGIADVYGNFTAKLDQPLFVSVPTDRYLQDQLKLDATLNKRMVDLATAKEGKRLLELAGLKSPPLDITKVTLVKVGTPAGNNINGMANLTASSSGGSWDVSVRSISLPGLPVDQWPRERFSGAVFDVGRDDERARLRALADEQPKILARLERAREEYAVEVMVQHKKQEELLVPFFRPGTVFTGTISGRTPNDKKPIYLEVTEAAGGSGVHPLKAMFHNDGGWGDGRLFEGDWKFDVSKERFQLSLVSRSDRAIRYGGPVLDDPKMVNLEMAIESDQLTGQIGANAVQLTRVPDGDTERVKRAASPDYFAMLDAMALESFYLGAVKLSETSTEQILLRFARGANGSATVEAVLQDPDREASQFKLIGTLIGNRYREANWPLRLAEVRDSVPPGIPPKAFVAQFRALALRMESGALMGDYRNRPFRFEPLSPEETARRLRTTAGWRRAFDSSIRPGSVLVGTASDPGKTLRTSVRLRVSAVDSAKGTIEARLESVQTPTLFRNVSGKIFADAGVLSFVFDIRANTYGIARTAIEPWFKGGRDNLTLTVDDMALAGQDGHAWSFEFRLIP